MNFEERLKLYFGQIETFLHTNLDSVRTKAPAPVGEAMAYSLLDGGKRLRPTLTLEFCRVSGGDPVHALPFACALEMIHTYSLIHDDLPCMDDDDLRRGKPTNHKVYGEAMAVLAGDALLTHAFEVAAHPRHLDVLPAQAVLRATHILASQAGTAGMIGGQVLDIQAQQSAPGYDGLVRLQDMKTGALIAAAARMGCVLGGASERQLACAEIYAKRLGLAFQIRDDILDIEGDEAVFGKPIGSDASRGKATFPALLGVDACKTKICELTGQAVAALEGFEDQAFLSELAQRLVARTS